MDVQLSGSRYAQQTDHTTAAAAPAACDYVTLQAPVTTIRGSG